MRQGHRAVRTYRVEGGQTGLPLDLCGHVKLSPIKMLTKTLAILVAQQIPEVENVDRSSTDFGREFVTCENEGSLCCRASNSGAKTSPARNNNQRSLIVVPIIFNRRPYCVVHQATNQIRPYNRCIAEDELPRLAMPEEARRLLDGLQKILRPDRNSRHIVSGRLPPALYVGARL